MFRILPTTTTKMAAPSEHDSKGEKVKKKTWQYAQDLEPDKESIAVFLDTMLNCEVYNSEYIECKSFKGKLDSLYKLGEATDCEYLQDTYNACQRYQKSKDIQAKNYLIEYEIAKRDYRMTGGRENDVWEYRQTPYTVWDKPLQKVSQDEIKEEFDLLHPNVNINMNNANSENQNMPSELEQEQTSVTSEPVNSQTDNKLEDQSSGKGGNSQCVIS